MWMSESEIRKLYKNAKNQYKEITILSELNLCSEKEIENIILKGGLKLPPEPQIKNKKGGKK